MNQRRPVRRHVPTFSEQFVEYALRTDAIELKERELRSGRLSPYFFNSGKFNSGNSMRKIASAYARTIRDGFRKDGNFIFDVLYGPPYKGTMLAPAVVMELDTLMLASAGYGPPFYYCSSRKEEKNHGERGLFLGKPIMRGDNVLIVDDVITDGGTKKEAVKFIEEQGAKTVGLVIAFDRQEKGVDSDFSAAQEFEKEYHVPVVAVATLKDLVAVLKNKGDRDEILERICAYQEKYGV